MRILKHNIVADVAPAPCPAPHRASASPSPANPATRPFTPTGAAPLVSSPSVRIMQADAYPPDPHPARFRLEFDDGTSLAVRGRGLIGRNPAAAAGERIEHLAAIADDTCSMSRTHLEFGVGENGLWVRDCASTNGSAMEVNGLCTPLEPGLAVSAPPGCTIHMGARRLAVRTMMARSAPGPATIAWGAATHVGAVRENNQDAYCAVGPVFVVADGVGGHAAGDVAAREAVQALLPLADHGQVTDETLKACLADARARIGRIPVEHGRPPGTTLSGVIVTQVDDVPSWMVINIGDSRTYRLDSQGLCQLTIDHSVVQELVDAGAIASSEARSHPCRNVLTRALVAEIRHPADLWLLPINAADRILVCSDGLTNELDDEFIASVLRAIRDPQAAANQLVSAAVDAGGRDNVTALVIDAAAVPSRLPVAEMSVPRV